MVVEVARRPGVAPIELDDDRRVVDDARERIAAGLERGEIDGGLDQRADLPAGVERAIESFVVRVAAADERLDLARVRARHDDGAFELRRVLAERLRCRVERALGRGLHRGIERRQHDEPRALEVVARIVGRELPAHEAQERRVHRAAAVVADQAELLLGGVLDGVVARETFVGHALQHEVAPLECAVRVAARIVVGGAAHLCHEQRELVQLELRERLAEIELAREPEAVDRARAVLAQIDLVDVRVQQARSCCSAARAPPP